ncbi:hypothetical protein PPNSA23_45900 [Phyllobacterium phragmitis]|uniref:Uncharacterized protein n=1 Tax=Phyllobacterium phragmitis TaxID=2670329 RepID=A0ABQ0H6Y1_9HYPH
MIANVTTLRISSTGMADPIRIRRNLNITLASALGRLEPATGGSFRPAALHARPVALLGRES